MSHFYEGLFERWTHFYEGLLGLHIHFYEGLSVMQLMVFDCLSWPLMTILLPCWLRSKESSFLPSQMTCPACLKGWMPGNMYETRKITWQRYCRSISLNHIYHQYYNCNQMIKTLSDYNLLESEEWKDSINTLFLELRSKLPEFFKEVPLPTIPHKDYVEVVIPASKQVMMEDLVEWLEKKLGHQA